MLHVDLEEVSSKQIRQHLEEDMEMDLSEFRSFIDQTIMVILGQMEKPSMIKDYLYLVRNYLHRCIVLLECFWGRRDGGGLSVYEGQYPKVSKGIQSLTTVLTCLCRGQSGMQPILRS